MTNIPMVGDGEQPGWPLNGQARQARQAAVRSPGDRSIRTIDQDPERLEHGYRTADARDAAVAVLKWLRDTLALQGFEYHRMGEQRKGDLVIRIGYAGGEGEVEVKQTIRNETNEVEWGTRTVPDGLLRLTATTLVEGYAESFEPGTKRTMQKAVQVFLNEKAGLHL